SGKRIVVARDVLFDEAKSWTWEATQESMSGSMVQPKFMENTESPQNASMNQEEGPHTPLTPHSKNVSQFLNSTSIGGGSGMAEQSPSSSSSSVSVNDMEPFDTFDDTPVRGTRLLQKIYEREPMMTEEEVQDKYQQAGLLLLNEEPTSFHEATKDIQWMEAMHAEIDSIEKNRTDASGTVMKHKARLVAKGCVQQKGVDFEDVFAPVARMESIRLILALAAKENWIVHHLDVKSAFLNGELKEELTKDEGGKEVDPTKYRISKYMQSPKESHYAAVKKILRYLKGTIGYGLKYPKGGNGKICEYNDSSHASDIEDRRSTTDMVFYYSQYPVTWAS
nr:hypothetical protein [Tanacetum cinerariifolium]